MKINIEEMANGLAAILGPELAKDAGQMKDYTLALIKKRKERLEQLAGLLADQKITAAELHSEIEDERDVVEAHFLAIQAMGKASAQRAANAAIKFFQDYILKLI